MDDDAASQQLLSEARTTHATDYDHDGPTIPFNLDGASRNTITNTPEPSKKKLKKPTRKQLAHSQTSPRDTVHGSPPTTYALEDLQVRVGPSSSKGQAFPSTIPSTQIEVPDTRTEPQANRALSQTPLVSSQAVAPDALKKRSKKHKKKMQVEADLPNDNVISATPYETIERTIPISSEATEGQASRKRRRKDKSRTSVNNDNRNSETPAATQEAALGPPAEGSDEQSGVLGVEEQPLIPKTLLSKRSAERSQKLKSARKVRARTNAHEDALQVAPEALDADAELPNAADTTNAVRAPGTTQTASKRKRTKKDKQVTEMPTLDWEAPVRNLDETPAQPFTFEDSDDDGMSSRREKSKKVTRYNIGGIARKPKASVFDPNKTYQRARDDDDRTAADKALEDTHELGQPADKRTNGEFTADERELLRRAIRDYQERNGLDTADLVEIIQWHPARKNKMGENTIDQTEAQFKKDCDAFWDDVKSAGLLRRIKDIKKHVRSNYHTCQRGRWSQDEDEQLRELFKLHPGQWRLIGMQLNRLELDCYNRWNDYLRHGDNRATKRWNQSEEENFVRVLSVVCQRIEDYRASTGQPPLDDYIPAINWHEVCREMGDTRSRLQCQSKWKIMKARVPPATLDVEIKPREVPPPGQVPVKAEHAHDVEANGEDVHHANSSKKRKRQSGAGSGKASAKKRNRATPKSQKAFKSKDLITDSDNMESEPEL